MTMEITIRPADKFEVRDFFRVAFPPDDVWPAMLGWDRIVPCDELFVAVNDGRIVAAVTLASDGIDGSKMSTLATLFTLPECHHQGVGHRLCEFAIRRFIEVGKVPIHCDATTQGMKATINGLPDELRLHLHVDYSVERNGDEWEFYERQAS